MTIGMREIEELLSFVGRKALVTGAAGGIGQAVANRFAHAGAAVMLVDRDGDQLAKAMRDVPGAGSAGGRDGLKSGSPSSSGADGSSSGVAGSSSASAADASSHILDLSVREDIEAFWSSLEDDELPDILINNAGVYPMRDFLDVDEAMLRQTLGVNLEATMWMCQKFIERRAGKGGVIVNVSSIEAILPFKDGMVPYTMSKAGVLALTRGLARDYAADGFRINVIVPGAIKTPGTQHLMRQAITRLQFNLWSTGIDFQRRLPMKRWGDPDEVARVALFLASDMASYVQGAAIPVDGGFLST